MRKDPDTRLREEKINRDIYNRLLQNFSNNKVQQVPLEIPVVFHIVHLNGPENVPDSVIAAGLNELNLRFQNAAPYFDSAGTDIQILFCLASVDPYGNPTTGITRDVSVNTDITWTTGPVNDAALKNISRWEPNLYFNIWVIRSIISMNGYVGYSSFPVSAGNSNDGVVVQYNYLNGTVLAHEAGHYLGLYHTFEGGCLNDNCLLNGDHVCDTPPDATSNFVCPNNSCSTELNDTSGFNPFITDMDEVPDYMDYTSCSLLFTQGQSDRMNASLTLTRSTLLQSNGCGQHPGGSIPVASFTYSNNCNGTNFVNTSVNSVGAQWDFDSDGFIDGSGNNIAYQYPAIGNYTVTIYAAGYGGMDTLSQVIFAQPYPYQSYPMINGFSGVSASLYTGQLTLCQGVTAQFYGEPGMASYLWFNGDTTQNLSITNLAAPIDVSLTAVDSAGLTWFVCYPVHIEPAPATVPPLISVAGNDTIFCIGDTITLLFDYSPIFHTSLFWNSQVGVTTNWTDTSYTTVLPLSSNYWVMQTDSNGCMATTPTLIIDAIFPTYPSNIVQNNNILYYPPGNHFQWYINGVLIPNSDSAYYVAQQTGCYTVYSWWTSSDCGSFSLDSVCITISGIASAETTDLIVSPNPFSGKINIAGTSEGMEFIVYDVISRPVIKEPASAEINTSLLSPGIYTYQIRKKGEVIKKGKIIKQ